MKIKHGFILRNIADETIIVPIKQSINDFNGLLSLNESGTFLWKVLQSECEKEDIVDAFMKEYSVDEKSAAEDIDAFLESLIKAGVLD